MTVRVKVKPALLDWALDRSGRAEDEFPKLVGWKSGAPDPTLTQLEKFAKDTRTPIGYFFLESPPEEEMPIPDFRTIGDKPVARPSPDLLDTIYQCQLRQDWYRDYARSIGLDPISQVGSLTTDTPVAEAAAEITATLSFDIEHRKTSWTQTFAYLREQAEQLGVLVMKNGVVGSNSRRKLNPEEFRGFALVDPIAPVVFVNGADTRAAHIFTLLHELTHIWLGEGGLSNAALSSRTSHEIESWCNHVAAEILVPLELLRSDFNPHADLTEELDRLARRFKSSTLVVLRRVHEAGYMTWEDYRDAYRNELGRVMGKMESKGDGGDFYNTLLARVSRSFAFSVVVSTLEGKTLYTDAFEMLGFKKQAAFDELAHKLGVV